MKVGQTTGENDNAIVNIDEAGRKSNQRGIARSVLHMNACYMCWMFHAVRKEALANILYTIASQHSSSKTWVKASESLLFAMATLKRPLMHICHVICTMIWAVCGLAYCLLSTAAHTLALAQAIPLWACMYSNVGLHRPLALSCDCMAPWLA